MGGIEPGALESVAVFGVAVDVAEAVELLTPVERNDGITLTLNQNRNYSNDDLVKNTTYICDDVTPRIRSSVCTPC